MPEVPDGELSGRDRLTNRSIERTELRVGVEGIELGRLSELGFCCFELAQIQEVVPKAAVSPLTWPV